MYFIVSACLAGHICRYDGCDCSVPAVKALVEDGRAVAACPEVLGGLSVPRPRAEVRLREGGTGISEALSVFDENQRDLTKVFLEGAEKFVRIARENDCHAAILKTRSPSCGFGQIYDGTFSGKLKNGNGVTAAALLAAGFEIKTVE